SYYGSNYAKEVSYCGTTMKVYRAWFYNLDYGGLALFTTPHQIIFYGQSCPSDKVAYNGDYPSSGSNMILTCYQCPPNSENPGVYIDRWQDGVYPYCKCKPGWKNLDESNTAITYVYDTNGCETQMTCSIDIWASPTSRTILTGQSTTYTINLKNRGNENCGYSLSYSCPSGVSCTLSQTSISINSGETKTVTLTASSNTPGTYNLQVTASSTSPVTGYSSTASASLTVREAYTCAVSLVSDATTKTIEVGRSTTYTITVRNNGNTQCTYSISANCPYGVSCTLSHTTVVIPQGGSANVILTASSNTPGTYNLQVSANAQAYGGSSSIGLTLIVMEAANIPDVSISPTFATIDKDQEYRFTIYVKNTGTSRTTYNLLAECSQLECTLSKDSVTVDPGQTVTEYLTVRGTEVGEFVITVRAIGPKGEEDSAIAYIIVREVQQPQPEQEQKPPQYYEEEGIAIPEIIVVPTYLELEEGGKADIFINIKNIGNAPGTFKISAVCGELYCMLSQDTIYLNVGQEANIALNIYATKVGEHTITINVINGKSVSSEVKVVVKPRGIQALFPISTENLLIVILAILIVIIIVLLLRR
ncbi:MAG: DUF499 domain-containing protein, partial [Desulfurococcaceae archaeon]